MPEAKAISSTSEDVCTEAGIQIKTVYAADDCRATGGELPGNPPFTRGIHGDMYRGSLWTVRPLAGFGTPEDTNQRLRLLQEEGGTGLNVVFDYATNRGYDSTDPLAAGDAGQGGVAIDCAADVEALFDGLPLDKLSVSIVLSHPVAAGVLLAMYIVAAERRGIAPADLRGTLQNDFLMETVVLTAPNILEPSFSFRLSMDVVEYCSEFLPKWNPISYTGYNYREAGANAVQEVALVIAHATATLAEMQRRGVSCESVAPRLSSFFSADNDFFEEVAKYRAARRTYHEELSSRFGLTDPRSTKLRFHVQTAGSALTAQQPLNNIARSAYHALAAVLGGAQSLHISAYDEALCVPSEAAAVTALRTQQILIEETGVVRTADPLGGSYFVESLTAEIGGRVTDLLEEIDRLGGLVPAVQTGWVHELILGTAYRRELAITSGERRVVGVNVHTGDVPVPVELFRVPETLDRQRDKLERHLAGRDGEEVERRLVELRTAAAGESNTFPFLLAAARAGATVGECSGVFRDLHGGWHQPLK